MSHPPSISPETTARVAAAWSDLILAVAEGDNLRQACERAGLSPHQVRHYRLAHPEAQREWDLAREQSADSYADRVLEIVSNTEIDAVRARTMIDGLKWLASKRNPRVYNDKAQLDVNVRHIDLTRIIEAANQRLALSHGRQVIDIEPELTALEDLL